MVGADLQLVWLAIETQRVNGIDEPIFCIWSLSTDESELDVRIQVRAEILERQFESLDTLRFLDGQRNYLGVGSLVEKLLHAFYLGVVEIAKQKYVHLGTLFHGERLRLVADELFASWLSGLG